MNYFFPFIAALILSLSLTPVMIRIAGRAGWVARPNQIRWHKKVTPILGGAAIYAAFVISVLFFVKMDKAIAGLLAGTACIFLLGLLDDLLRIPAQTKLIGQILTACIILPFGIYFSIFPVRWIILPLTVFWFIGITNAFNLLDNMDGLSCGIAFIVSAFFFIYSLLNQLHTAALLSVIVAGAALGFLRYNFYPARIFMGDCGSQFLGLVIAIIAVLGTAGHISNLVVTLTIPLLILGVPIFDTTFVTLMRRMKGLPVFQGGKDHTSHRLVLLGLTEKKTVMFLYLLSSLFGLIALLYAKLDIIVVSILAVLTVIVLFFFGIFLGETKTYTDKELADLRGRQLYKEKTVLNAFYLNKRRIAEVIIDFALVCVSYYAAHLLRYEGNVYDAVFALMIQSLPWLIAARLGCFYYFGLYRGIWRYIGIKDLLAIFKAVSASSIMTILFLTFFFRFADYSRVVFVIDWILILFLTAGARILIRVLRESFVSLKQGEKKILIFGAGDAGEMVLREMHYNKGLNCHPLGFLDDDRKKVGRKIRGVPVLGTRDELPRIVREKGIEEIVIAIPSATQEMLESLLQECRKCGVQYKRMRGILWE